MIHELADTTSYTFQTEPMLVRSAQFGRCSPLMQNKLMGTMPRFCLFPLFSPICSIFTPALSVNPRSRAPLKSLVCLALPHYRCHWGSHRIGKNNYLFSANSFCKHREQIVGPLHSNPAQSWLTSLADQEDFISIIKYSFDGKFIFDLYYKPLFVRFGTISTVGLHLNSIPAPSLRISRGYFYRPKFVRDTLYCQKFVNNYTHVCLLNMPLYSRFSPWLLL